jgi:hypothetical protein
MGFTMAGATSLLSDLAPILKRLTKDELDYLEEIGAIGDRLKYLLKQCEDDPDTLLFVIKQRLAGPILFDYRSAAVVDD